MTITDLQIEKQLNQLLELHPKRIDLSLDRILSLLAKLNNPQNNIQNIIHIAGTNGKYSTLKFIQSILQTMQKTTNAYISPHLIRFNERFELGTSIISNKDLSLLLTEVKNTNANKPITFFEITSACFFLAALRNKADYTLLEVGLGGRLDSSNVMTPKISVISSISNDHHDFLGDTIEKIAYEKAGIIKANIPVVIGRQPFTEALDVLIEQAGQHNAPTFIYNKDWNIKSKNNKIYYTDPDGEVILEPLKIHGDFQIYNLGLAIATVKQVEATKINDALIKNNHLEINLPGRVQQIRSGKYQAMISSENELFLDGSHNKDAAFQLNKTLQNLTNQKDLIIILGMINTKDPKSYIAQFKNIKEIKTITIPNEESAISATTLNIELQETGIKVSSADNLDEAIQSISSDHPAARILICGSLYLAGQVLKNN
ncbi:Mur ligase family protein [Pelagibacteraceae bacterium]|nr:Mur ligase family protein [Pelagibacteraceae bacterium]